LIIVYFTKKRKSADKILQKTAICLNRSLTQDIRKKQINTLMIINKLHITN